MADKFVRKTGSDSNGGTSTSDAWLTINKAATTASSGDAVYIGAGTYRENIAFTITPAAETRFVADVDGAKTGDAGEVVLTAYTTNDTTNPVAATAINLNGKDFLTFEKLVIVGGDANPSCVTGVTTTSTDVTFRDCTFIVGRQTNCIIYDGAANVALNLTFDRCIFLGAGSTTAIQIRPATSASADWDLNVLVQNCLFLLGSGGNGVNLAPTGAASFKPGGVDVLNCTFVGGANAFITGANSSTGTPSTINNSVCYAQTTACLNAQASGQITENYNLLEATTARTNVTAGANSIATGTTYQYATLVQFGQEFLQGKAPRPVWSPMAGSPLLGFGNTGAPAVDFLNRPRPAGGASTANAIGYLERHDTAVQETSVTQAGSSAIKITGPGDHHLQVPVDATSATIAVYVRYDTNHATTNKPQVTLLANGQIGVATETKTATVGVDTWEQLTFSAFTPTDKGFVTIRCISRSAAGNGIAYFDTFSGGAPSSAGLDYFRIAEPFPAAVRGQSMKVHPGMQGNING